MRTTRIPCAEDARDYVELLPGERRCLMVMMGHDDISVYLTPDTAEQLANELNAWAQDQRLKEDK